MGERDIRSIQKACTRFLPYHYPQTTRQVLSDLAEIADPDILPDMYGQGELITRFEEQVARQLGKEAAVFMPSGTMCQQIALRIWTDRRSIPSVAFHPTCHLEIHEQRGYQVLHGLQGIHVGSPDRLITLDALQAIAEPIGALLLELPQREIGGQLPDWDELISITSWARERGIIVHLDGARLWECQPFYGRPYAEIAGLFDSVYISFYKILQGIAGAILAGPAAMIAEARVWQRRHGGNLIRLYPYVLSAQKGLNEHLDRIELYCKKASEVAAALSTLPQIEVMPNPPQTNMMHLFLRGDAERLKSAALDIAEETGTWLFGFLAPSQIPAYQRFELTVGEATLDIPTQEIVSLFQRLFEKAEQN